MAGGARSLAGRRILVTRARSQASVLAEKIRELGGEPWELPLIAIAPPESWAPLDEALAHLARYRWLVVTSANGAAALAERLAAAGGIPASLRPAEPRPDGGLRVAAVGAATARALGEAGIRVDLIPPEFRGAALPGAIVPLLAPGDRVLMPRGDLADPALADRLRERGAVVDDRIAYRTLPEEGEAATVLQALAAGAIDYVTLTSSSTVRNLIRRLGGPEPLAGARIACIGPETRKAAEEAGLQVAVVPEQATLDALVRAIAEHAAPNNTQGGC